MSGVACGLSAIVDKSKHSKLLVRGAMSGVVNVSLCYSTMVNIVHMVKLDWKYCFAATTMHCWHTLEQYSGGAIL